MFQTTLVPYTSQEYLRQNRYTVTMPIGNIWYERNILECKIPDISFTAQEWWDGTVFNRMVSRAVFNSISMSLYLDTQSDPLFNWILQYFQHFSPFQGAIVKAPDISTYKIDMYVRLLDGMGQDIYSWILKRCQLVNVNFSELTYQSEGQVMTASLEILPDRVILPGQSATAPSSNAQISSITDTPSYNGAYSYTTDPSTLGTSSDSSSFSYLGSSLDPPSTRDSYNSVSQSFNPMSFKIS